MKSKKSLWIALAVVAVVVIAAVGWIMSTYNGLVETREQVTAQQANVQSQLQRRADLIPNLVSTVQAYATHEEEVYTALADARAALAGASTVDELNAANSALDSALSRLLVVVENYPELQASQNFINLQDELAGTENRIAQARRDYNEAVQEYNVKLRRFPSNLIAGMFGFEQADLFESDEGASSVPEVSF